MATLSGTDDGVDLHTTFVDWTTKDVFLLSVNKSQSPKSCVAFGHAFDMNRSETDPVPVSFTFEAHGPIVGHVYWAQKGRPEEVNDYSLPLPRVIQGVAKTDLQINRSYMQELLVCETGGFFVSYRMPAESAAFGYPIRACFAFSDSGPRQWYTCINGSGLKHARVQHPGKDFDPVLPDAKQVTKDTCRRLYVDNQYKQWSGTYSDLVYRTVASTEKISAKTLSAEESHARERVFYQLMRRIRDQVDRHLNDGTSLFLDPFVRGMVLEQALWRPDRSPATVTHLLSRVLRDLESSSGDSSLSYSLFCAYADLGFAPNETSHAMFMQSAQGQAFATRDAAAILARWRWPTEQRHVDTTVEFIKTAKHITDKLNCVETLILMDELDLVPADLLQRWFAEIKGGPDKIRRPLNLLMQNAAGRRYLADKFLALPDDAPLREPIRDLFANELTHVRESEDYRFWTKEECDRLESDLQLELTGNEKR
ncbi:hypothetical protein [Roseimaritima sediminicola]|uniref:hypothetical protein n=1 Tax=Roseimaritima sediminicola TaxID=2662066 RepID=UPI00129823E6|nr:hypothetical protein [Roseimaritima sediminicola]